MSQEKKKALGRGLESLLPRKPGVVSGAAAFASAPATSSPAVQGGGQPVHGGEVPGDGHARAEGDGEGPFPPGLAFLADLAESPDGRIRAVRDTAAEALAALAEASKLDVETALKGAAELQRRYSAEYLAEHKIRQGEMVIELPLHLIERNPWQTRTTHIDDPALVDLIQSIKEQGVLQPVVVRPLKQPGHSGQLYHLIAGERRWLASRRAGKSHIPAIVRNIPDQQVALLTIIENLHREDLNPMQHARAFEALSRQFGLTQDEVAQRCAISRTAVTNYMRLNRLPEELQKAIEDGRLSFGHAKALMPMSTGQNSPEMVALARKVMNQRLSVRETEMLVEEWLHPLVKEPAAERKVDPNVRAAEMELERSLGCRVRIADRSGKGRIVIEYKSLEDFDRVVQALK